MEDHRGRYYVRSLDYDYDDTEGLISGTSEEFQSLQDAIAAARRYADQHAQWWGSIEECLSMGMTYQIFDKDEKLVWDGLKEYRTGGEKKP